MSDADARIEKVHATIIPVSDPDAMLAFYTDKLGLEKRVDVPFGGDYRWIEVGPEGAETNIALAPPPPGKEDDAGGRETGISLRTADIDSFHAELKEAGVDVDEEISRMGDPVPPMFWLRDPEGNVLLVVQ